MGIAHELVTRGWTQGKWRAEDGAVCLEGAIQASVCGKTIVDMTDAELNAHEDELCRIGDVVTGLLPGCSILHFNDTTTRTFDEVLRVAKEADELLEAGQ